MKRNPTRQEHGMYENLNEKGASHSVPHKELNAMGSRVEQNPWHYEMGTAVRENYKSIRGHVSGEVSHMPNSASGFSESQIPNTKPKSPHTSGMANLEKKVSGKSKSMIFHN